MTTISNFSLVAVLAALATTTACTTNTSDVADFDSPDVADVLDPLTPASEQQTQAAHNGTTPAADASTAVTDTIEIEGYGPISVDTSDAATPHLVVQQAPNAVPNIEQKTPYQVPSVIYQEPVAPPQDQPTAIAVPTAVEPKTPYQTPTSINQEPVAAPQGEPTPVTTLSVLTPAHDTVVVYQTPIPRLQGEPSVAPLAQPVASQSTTVFYDAPPPTPQLEPVALTTAVDGSGSNAFISDAPIPLAHGEPAPIVYVQQAATTSTIIDLAPAMMLQGQPTAALSIVEQQHITSTLNHYNRSLQTGRWTLPSEALMLIPATLSLEQGLAGNGLSSVIFGNMVCEYVGTTNSAGSYYAFDECHERTGAALDLHPGDTIDLGAGALIELWAEGRADNQYTPTVVGLDLDILAWI